jgi:cytochrome c oxidase subunit 2
MRKLIFWISTIFISIFVLLLCTAGCGNSFSSNGQRIFFSAESDSGKPITYSGGPGMMQSRIACVNCHGQDGHGGRVRMMMYDFDVPNITWPELTAQGHDYPPYTEDTLKQAIVQGIDPAGEPLEYPMPRWQMSDSDLNDLVGFIKTLK